MGCFPSCVLISDNNETDASFEAYDVKRPIRQAPYKRNYCKRQMANYDSSSGVSSAHTSPAGRNISLRDRYKPAASRALKFEQKAMCNVLPVCCDDFDEIDASQQQCLQEHKSFGYYSEDNSDVSTPMGSCMLRTQEISENTSTYSTAVTSPPNSVKMEVYMMSRTKGLMPKISSPICQRRDPSSDSLPMATKRLHSASYQKWVNYLEESPAYMSQNITHLPEAISGRFCPLHFPAYTNLGVLESAHKDYEIDHKRPCNVLRNAQEQPYIESTEL
uniref:Uncharacterized protein n=1 Tax=Glossina austeni TaxID=7395 RepID=A0A1A9ULM1_GLOAU